MGNRGLANRALYQAQILLDAWAAAAGSSADPKALDTAFLDAVRHQLRFAYGWYLLAIVGADGEADARRLPSCVDDLPAPEPGRALAPEIREFAQLEREGWLCDLLTAPATVAPAPRGALATDRAVFDRVAVQDCLQALRSTMLRMDDSLNEC